MMCSIKIVEEIRRRLNTYNLSPIILESAGLKKGWQETIPDFVIQIIVEQTQSIILEQPQNIILEQNGDLVDSQVVDCSHSGSQF